LPFDYVSVRRLKDAYFSSGNQFLMRLCTNPDIINFRTSSLILPEGLDVATDVKKSI